MLSSVPNRKWCEANKENNEKRSLMISIKIVKRNGKWWVVPPLYVCVRYQRYKHQGTTTHSNDYTYSH